MDSAACTRAADRVKELALRVEVRRRSRAVAPARPDRKNPSLQCCCRPGDRGRALEESPDTEGQDAGETQAAKADGKWHRKETAKRRNFISGDAAARVKRWGKSPPASW